MFVRIRYSAGFAVTRYACTLHVTTPAGASVAQKRAARFAALPFRFGPLPSYLLFYSYTYSSLACHVVSAAVP